MSDNWFVQHPEVTRYIMKTERMIKEVARENAQRIMALVSGKTVVDLLEEFNAVPSYCERFVKLVHTPDHPFCSDGDCPCHNLFDNGEVYDAEIGRPLVDGLLTHEEAYRILWDRQI